MFMRTYDCSERRKIKAGARLILLSGVEPTIATDDGEIMCMCFGVGVKILVTAIEAKMLMSVEAIGQALQAGTNCGSCTPELKELLRT